jgi:cyclomaltodextrinase / maltogenic alpha-amylase / neopullulanase
MAEVTTPEWVRHAVFYQIFPDRFAISDHDPKPSNLEPWDSEPTARGYKGGDLWGVIERLDWLQELGVTALYFNPIFQSASNHRYHTHDYYQVDPLLGGNPAFDALLAECKRRGLRVVLDGVFNHASRGFFQFNDILENGAASPWIDWFTVHTPDGDRPINAYDHAQPPDYEAWVGLHALPKFNTDNPQVREYIMQIAEYWLRKGIDGWRLDVPEHVTTPGFWAEFRQRVKAINPDAYIVGEIWFDARQWLQGDQFDGVMNYLWTEATIAYTANTRVRPAMVDDRSYAPQHPLSGTRYADRIDELLALYPWPIQLTQLNLLDSHDTARFVTIASDDEASVRLGTLLLFTMPGAPSIYYGDEIGLSGGRPDAMARRTFPWDHPERWNRALLDFHKRVIALRKAHEALRVGSYRRVYADDTSFVFERALATTRIVVALNAGDVPATIPLGATNRSGALLCATTDARQFRFDDHGLHLPARSGVVLRPES